VNYLNVINPYKYHGQWVFDDETRGLDKEALVSGADTLLDLLTDDADNCLIIFSKGTFPDYDFSVVKVEEEEGAGTDYLFTFKDGSTHLLWLCPALLKYFESPPETIYFRLGSLTS